MQTPMTYRITQPPGAEGGHDTMDLPEIAPKLNIKTLTETPLRDWSSMFAGRPTAPTTPDDALQRVAGAPPLAAIGALMGCGAANVRFWLKNYLVCSRTAISTRTKVLCACRDCLLSCASS